MNWRWTYNTIIRIVQATDIPITLFSMMAIYYSTIRKFALVGLD